MKLIIEIPEEYKALFDTERCKSKFDSLATNEFGYVLRKAFENGTPLDSVIAEMDEQYDRVRPYNIDVAQGLEMALEILDNIGKESEGKE